MNGWRSTWRKLRKRHANQEDEDDSFGQRDDSALPPIELQGYISSTRDRLLPPELSEDIRTLLPRRIQLYTTWYLVYNLEQHGASLHSLYDRVRRSVEETKHNSRVGYLLVLQDRRGGIFGGYSNQPLLPTEGRRYTGNGECFLWRAELSSNALPMQEREQAREQEHSELHTASNSSASTELHPSDAIPGSKSDHSSTSTDVASQTTDQQRHSNQHWQFRGYTYTGVNVYSLYCTNYFLSMGAGDGRYGLWCDEGLMHGVSNRSLTFGNDVLSREGSKFHITGVEVWRIG